MTSQLFALSFPRRAWPQSTGGLLIHEGTWVRFISAETASITDFPRTSQATSDFFGFRTGGKGHGSKYWFSIYHEKGYTHKHIAEAGETYYGFDAFIQVRLFPSPAELMTVTKMLKGAQMVVRNRPILFLPLP